jgi:hypothetical protein
MSIEQLGEKEFARRNLWEATLFDENHNPIVWSTGLIKSTNIPKLSFTVEDILAGTSKGYMGWKLPDNLSISIWETSDHAVEKYLDEWMIGKTGIFNPETGAFRVQPSEDYLYRDVKIKTFIYEYTESKPYQVKKKDAVSALALTMQNGLTEQLGAVSVGQQEYIHAASEIAVSVMEKIIANPHATSEINVVGQHAASEIVVSAMEKIIANPYATSEIKSSGQHAASEIVVSAMENIIANQHATSEIKSSGQHAASEIVVSRSDKVIANQHNSADIQEKVNSNNNDTAFTMQYSPMQTIVMVEKKQVIPVLDKITAAIGGLANQAISGIPLGSDITRRFIPPVIIPPLLMRLPIPTGTPVPQLLMAPSKFVRLQDKVAPMMTSKVIQLQDKIMESTDSQDIQLRGKIEESTDSQDIQFQDKIEESTDSQDIQLRGKIEESTNIQDIQFQDKIEESANSQDIQLRGKIEESTDSKVIQLQDKIEESTKEKSQIILQAIKERKQKVALAILDGIRKKVEDVLVEFAAGEATKAKQWKAREKITSLVTYSTAIEGYDIGTYDYSTGDGVSYTINLAVRNIKIEYPT